MANREIVELKKSKIDDLLTAFKGKTDQYMKESRMRVEKLEITVAATVIKMKMLKK